MRLEFLSVEPHLVEKLRMLSDGTLSRPIDIFDLLYHLAPLVLLGIRLERMRRVRAVAAKPPGEQDAP